MSLTTLRDLLRIWRRHPVTRGNVIGSMRRFATWQLASRLHGGKLVVPFVHPTRLVVARGQTGLTGNIYFGLAEMHEMAFLLHYLRGTDVFVDVGANMGSFSILASGVVGARSIAFEPIDATITEFREQLRLNDIVDRVDIRAVALGAAVGTVRFLDTLNTVNRVVADGETRSASRDVPQSTLDIELAGIAPALIKMDVEGYEYAVLQGASQVLAKPTLEAIIMEVHEGTSNYGVDRAALEAIVRAAGFKPYIYDATRRVLTLTDFAAAHAHGLSDNVLMVRNIETVRGRILTAPPFSVLGVSF